MKTTINAVIAVIGVVVLASPTAFAANDRGKIVSQGEDGSVCYELDVKEDAAKLRKMEKMVDEGRLKEAFDAATGPSPGCLAERENGDERIFKIIERTYKKLGQQAEKAGRIYEAHNYYFYPYRYFRNGSYRGYEKNYSLNDAHRTMLAYAKAHPEDYKVVQEAVDYFTRQFETAPPQFKEVKGLVMRGGDRLLAKEQNDFAARKYKPALEDLKESKRWFAMLDDDQRVQARAKLRGETLLAESSYDVIEHAFDYYYEFNLKLEFARNRALKLGDEADRKGNLELARKFYYLSGDEARQKSVDKRLNAIQEQEDRQQEQKERQRTQAESKRQEKFKKEQDSLEKELGL